MQTRHLLIRAHRKEPVGRLKMCPDRPPRRPHPAMTLRWWRAPVGARLDGLQIAQLTRERDQLRIDLHKAELVIEVQKKVTALLDLLTPCSKRGGS